MADRGQGQPQRGGGQPQRRPNKAARPAGQQPQQRQVVVRRDAPRPPSGGFAGKLIKAGVALVAGFCLVTMGMHSMNLKKEDGTATWPWEWSGEDWKNWATFTRKTGEDLGRDVTDKAKEVADIDWQKMWDGLWQKGEDLGSQIKDRLAKIKLRRGGGGEGEQVAKADGESQYEVTESHGKQGLWGNADPRAVRKKLEEKRQAELEAQRKAAEEAAAKGETYEAPELAPLPTVEEIEAQQKAAAAEPPAEQPQAAPAAAEDDYPPEYVEAYEIFLEGLEHFKDARKDSKARVRAREKFEQSLDKLNVAIDKKPELVEDPLCQEVQQYLHDCIKDAKVGDF